jgi:UDP-glucose 4-epimerase
VRTALTPSTYGQALNVGGIRPLPLRDVAELCQELAGMQGSVEYVPWPPERKRIDIGSIYVDHSKLAELTGWEPRVELRNGLAETLAFYRQYGEYYWGGKSGGT